MSKVSVLWMNSEDLSEKEIRGLKSTLGEIELYQMSNFRKDYLKLSRLFETVDVIALRLGCLSPELQNECLHKKHIIYGIYNLEYSGWKLSK